MRKLFLFIFATMLAGQAWAYDFKCGDLCYNITSDTEHTVEVTYQDNTGGNNYQGLSYVAIPETITYNEIVYTVTGIGNWALSQSGITTVIIPNSVTYIGNYAFSYSYELTSIVIPQSVSGFSRETFTECRQATAYLETESKPENWMGYYASPNAVIYNTRISDDLIFKVKSKVPYTVSAIKYIGNSISVEMPSIVSVDGIEYAVVDIDGTFSGCSNITSVNIPNSVTTISGSAFNGCSSLTSISIPKSVTSISNEAFSGCNVETLAYNTNAVGSQFCGFTSILTVNIGDAVTSISDNAFSGCTELTTVAISESVKYVGKDAFKGCNKIDYLLDGGCYYVGNEDNPYVMLLQVKDTSISSVTINSDCKIIYDEAFKDCRKLKSVVIPDSVTCIGSNAFSGCTSLESVDFNANNCISMGSSDYPVFAGCTSLSFVTFGEKVKNIPEYAFYGCAGLTSIAVPASVTSIGVGAFVNCNFKVMRSMGTTPATMPEDPFPTVDTVYVPNDKINAYRTAAVWKRKEIFTVENHTITAASSNNERGLVSGTGSYTVCDNVKLTATPATNYQFDCWTDGNTDNPRVVTVKGDKTYTAKFVGVDCEITGTGTNGSVTGIGTHHYGDTVAITAVANTGYHFVKWSDGNTDNPRQIVVAQGLSFTPEFEISSFTITTYAENGTVTGGGTYTYGTQVTLTVTPDAGYRFKQWSDYIFNYSWGWSDGYYPTDNPRTITVTEDATYVPQFEKERYTIFVDGSAVYWKEYYAYYGDTLYLQVGTSNGGYRFANWADGNTDNPRMIVVTGNATYGVNFDNKYLLKFDSNGGDYVDSMVVSYGSYVNLPIPTRSGYTFIGWQYKGQDGETYTRNEFEVYSDMQFVAVWEKANNTAIAENAANTINIYAHGRTIVVENATEEIYVYNAMGALVGRDSINRVRTEIPVNGAGVYLVKTGGTVKRVMVN